MKNINENLIFSTDFKEFSIHFEDVSLIISRIYPLSILEQITRIFKQVNNHFIHLTKELTEMPYEIYLPVFEEISVGSTSCSKHLKPTEYYKYWGLYFNSDSNMKVYDCRMQEMVDGDFFLTQ